MNINTESLAVEMEASHAPYEFTGPYAGCYRNRQMCMDERHVYTIFDVLTCWRFESALELGSYDGASSTAFVEAKRCNAVGNVRLCEVRPTDSLIAVIQNRPIQVDQRPSWEVLADGNFDFILVDANHDLASVSRELEHIMRLLPVCVMAHDTNATDSGYPHAEGARHLREIIRRHPLYRGKCIEDCVRRSGEETHRGLFFATTDAELYKAARDIFARRCPVTETRGATSH